MSASTAMKRFLHTVSCVCYSAVATSLCFSSSLDLYTKLPSLELTATVEKFVMLLLPLFSLLLFLLILLLFLFFRLTAASKREG